MKSDMNKKNRSSRHLVIYTLAAVSLIVAVFVIYQVVKNQASQTAVSAPSISSQPIMGNKDANVSIVEFGDYKCPSCKAWGEQILPRLKKDFIDLNQASFAYINVLFHGEESQLAALASEAVLKSNPKDFWVFHKALFDAQPEVNHDGLWITEEKLIEVVNSSVSGIEENIFLQNLKSGEIQSKVVEDQELVRQFFVKQTPTIMINNIIVTNPFDYDSIAAAIERELSR